MEKILLLGIGGHAHSVVDSIEQSGTWQIAGFLDTAEKTGLAYKEYKVLGTDEKLPDLYRDGIRNAFISVGYMGEGTIRERLFYRLKQMGFHIPVIIDRSAAVAQNVETGEGSFIGKNAVVNAGASIGNMCIVNSASVVEHDCSIGNFTHLAAGAVLCGGVHVGTGSFIGAGSTVIQGISIGSRVLIGAGTVITKNVADDTMKYGMVEKIKKHKDGQ